LFAAARPVIRRQELTVRLPGARTAPITRTSTCLSYAEPGSWDIKEPLPGTSNMPGSGGGGIVTCLVVKDRLGV